MKSQSTQEHRDFLKACGELIRKINQYAPFPQSREVQDSIDKLVATLDVYDEEYERLLKLLSAAKEGMRK